MINKTAIASSLVSLGIVFGIVSTKAVAQNHEMNDLRSSQTELKEQFQVIEQPLINKIVVTVGGLGVIGLELWWFLLSKPKSRQAIAQGSIQEVTITVDGGYEPSQIIVRAGEKVRLNFDRKDPSSCLEEVRFPDFQIAQTLPLNRVTAIEFTPLKPGKYEFTCGMNMFRGTLEVQPAEAINSISQPTSSPFNNSIKTR